MVTFGLILPHFTAVFTLEIGYNQDCQSCINSLVFHVLYTKLTSANPTFILLTHCRARGRAKPKHNFNF